ncbi:peptidase associated/transthyretin-like domain-containing protein [Pedobacter duraquae]|uniref:Carboxypeptidase-like protein n=1 Tax=Pedobacter duraquae TaxID=425511 RepID=A0A4R6IDH5_9SPHI|nr:hypothetical protein [Pedobacter duraquae]TDO19598.1 hypothetical protein CLV32_4220 [Pedobacter duraquae]
MISKCLQLRFSATIVLLFSLVFASPIQAQDILNKKITIESKNERLSEVLTKIEKAADFYFSYNGKLIARDSLVSISAHHITVSNLLKQLFSDRLEIEERRNYLIITPAMGRMSMINTDAVTDRSTYSVSGLVIDEFTKERLVNVSVYEKHQLVSTLTDEHGYFRLKLKLGNPGFITLTASKLAYRDTSLNMLQNVNISKRYNAEVYTNIDGNNKDVERTALGKLLISARQRIQSMNIPDFFAHRPIQFSLVPGLSSHGMFSSQVINKFSLNVIGGYTAGVNGFELGGLFNINKLDAKYVQAAGFFNLTGGKVIGLQVAGIHNEALGTLRGVQFAGFINTAASDARGMQVASLSNTAKSLHGIQIGIVNTVDSSEGISIGLINIIRNGFYRIGLSTNNLTNTNISLKTGTHQFYSMILISSNLSTENKLYGFGLGIGHDFMLGKNTFISAEGNYQFAYTGGWDDRWAQAKLLLNIPVSGRLSLVTGPTYNKYSYTGSIPGYQKRFRIEPGTHRLRNPVERWLGWEAGIAYNSVFKAAAKKTAEADSWFLGVGIHAGIGWDNPVGLFTGAELFMQRELNSAISGTVSTGYSIWFGGNEQTDRHFNIIPLKAGIRTYTGKRLFFAGDAGLAIGVNNAPRYALSVDAQGIRQTTIKSGNSFLYTVSMGYDFDNGIETGIKFEDYTAFSFIKQFALRIAYRIKL